jgi:C4-dicarboxylate transporter DctQ subunit
MSEKNENQKKTVVGFVLLKDANLDWPRFRHNLKQDWGISFSDEITTKLFILLSMLGTAIAAKRRAHLGLSILTDAVSPKTRRAMLIFGYGLSTVFSFLVFFYGIKMVQSEYILGQVTPAMQWPEWVYGLFVPFGAIFMTLRFAQITLEEIRTPADKVLTDAEIMIEEAAEEAAEALKKEDDAK